MKQRKIQNSMVLALSVLLLPVLASCISKNHLLPERSLSNHRSPDLDKNPIMLASNEAPIPEVQNGPNNTNVAPSETLFSPEPPPSNLTRSIGSRKNTTWDKSHTEKSRALNELVKKMLSHANNKDIQGTEKFLDLKNIKDHLKDKVKFFSESELNKIVIQVLWYAMNQALISHNTYPYAWSTLTTAIYANRPKSDKIRFLHDALNNLICSKPNKQFKNLTKKRIENTINDSKILTSEEKIALVKILNNPDLRKDGRREGSVVVHPKLMEKAKLKAKSVRQSLGRVGSLFSGNKPTGNPETLERPDGN